jgi:hypothetical protein
MISSIILAPISSISIETGRTVLSLLVVVASALPFTVRLAS